MNLFPYRPADRDPQKEPHPPLPWRRMLGYLKPYRGRMVLVVIFKLLAASMSLVLPVVIQRVVDSVVIEKDAGQLDRVSLLLLGAFLLTGIASVIGNYTINFIGERVVMDLRRQLYAHLQTLSLRFFTTRRVGELISRMSSDVTAMRSLLTNDLVKVIRQIITLIGGLTVMTVLNWRLTSFVMLATPLLSLVGVVISNLSRRGSRTVQDEIADATVVAEEVLQNVREVKSFGREDYEIARYNRALDRAFRALLRVIHIRSMVGPVMDFMIGVDAALILWYGGHEVLDGRLTGGELISFLIYVGIIGQAFSDLGALYTRLQETLGATQRVFEILDTPSDLQDTPGARVIEYAAGRITFDAVNFAYDSENPVLQDINLDIAPGEIMALVGPSGAGKSTMFNLIPRFYDVTGGALTIDGIDVRQITQASLRAQISIVPQETLLFGGSIRENIFYGRLDASEEEMIDAARAANAHDFVHALPEGYETIVGERGVRLSGGQRQRVAIARAILKNPRILLLDEATSSLDNESEQLVQEALDRLMQGRTTVIIAHRLSTIRMAHRIAVLEAGRIVELGPHDELMARGGLYARLYEMQFRAQDLLAR